MRATSSSLSRRRALRTLATLTCLPLGSLLPSMRAWAAVDASRRWQLAVPLMGTRVDLHLAGAPADDLQTAASSAVDEMQRLARMMSRYETDNALAAVHAAAGRRAVAVPPELMAVLRTALDRARRTGGAFDPTVGALRAWHFDAEPDTASDTIPPAAAQVHAQRRHVGWRHLHLDARAGTAHLDDPEARLDLGGIAKLPILQAGLDVLARAGVPHVLLNGGGDVLVRGGLEGRPWTVGVRDARDPQRLLGRVTLTDGVVASSGDYERGYVHAGRRYHHVLDPATGYPAATVHGAVLLAPDGWAATGWGTAAMVLGPARGEALLAEVAPMGGGLMAVDGGLRLTPPLAARLA